MIEQQELDRSSEMTTCIVCLENIKTGAYRCSHCGSHQKRWRNTIPIVVATVTILTFLSSAVVGILAITTNIWKQVDWKDELRIVSYDSSRLVVLNSGSGELFIESIAVESAALKNDNGQIYKKLTPVWSTVEKDSFANIKAGSPPTGKFVEKLSDEKWELAKRGLIGNISPRFFLRDESRLKMVIQSTPKIRIFKAKCMIKYRSSVNHNLTKDFPCVGTFVFVRTIAD